MIDTGTAITLAVVLPVASLIVAILGYKLAKSKKEQDDLRDQRETMKAERDEAIKNANDMAEIKTDIKLIQKDVDYIKTDFDKRLTRLETRPAGARKVRTPASKD